MKKSLIHSDPRNYPVLIGNHEFGKLIHQIRPLLSAAPILVSSRTIAKKWLKKLTPHLKRNFPLRTILLPDGEKIKNLGTAQHLYSMLLKMGADRKTPLLLLGGGVIGDLGGFVASTYLRGIPYIQIPTTLVAQIDSSIGGKVAIDLPQGKNLVGSFYPPIAVLTDLMFLKTLPQREWVAGLAEAIKASLIADRSLYDWIQSNKRSILRRDPIALKKLIPASIRIKAAIVKQDERETTGLRHQLNLGHTFGHAIEKLTHYRRYRHGEAVAIGLLLATRLSARFGFCPPSLPSEIKQLLKEFSLPTEPPRFSKRDWLDAITVDKKRRQGMIQFVFLRKIGKVVVKPIDPKKLLIILL